ncbi:NERD domain-containing protein [Halalkalibacter sp. APA_J-10(15)]|uniref:NERD domain-containing protein n=1 Tax=Halalkalibacter sp. APA_J-10(15) TaxID=2933805 RepID=UPI001FF301CA|nr:NERD domain-containing protein [Halalkalibacter sp. APA_J-10(15)]MCK0470074.1 NERD domain-containing protein [Halalkalibacter sp. APA_J-10(15)]
MAGYKGERSLEYELSFLDPKRYDLFHDVRLAVGDYFAQFDLLIVCSCFIVVVEVKNIAGQLYFDPDFHQLIRTFEGEVETFPDPILQNERQATQLQRWLSSNRFPATPILPLVVISSPHSQIQTKKGHESLSHYVIHKSFLPQMIQRYERIYQQTSYTNKNLRQLTTLLLQRHEAAAYSLLSDWGIAPAALQRGTHCPSCDHLPLIRTRGKWLCASCGEFSQSAHFHTLRDYVCLIDGRLTNEEAQHFLQITSKHLVRSWLKRIAVSDGKKRRQSYEISLDSLPTLLHI